MKTSLYNLRSVVASHPSRTQYCKMAEMSVAAIHGGQQGCGKKGDAWRSARKQDEGRAFPEGAVYSLLSPSKTEESIAAEVRQRQMFANKWSRQ